MTSASRAPLLNHPIVRALPRTALLFSGLLVFSEAVGPLARRAAAASIEPIAGWWLVLLALAVTPQPQLPRRRSLVALIAAAAVLTANGVLPALGWVLWLLVNPRAPRALWLVPGLSLTLWLRQLDVIGAAVVVPAAAALWLLVLSTAGAGALLRARLPRPAEPIVLLLLSSTALRVTALAAPWWPLNLLIVFGSLAFAIRSAQLAGRVRSVRLRAGLIDLALWSMLVLSVQLGSEAGSVAALLLQACVVLRPLDVAWRRPPSVWFVSRAAPAIWTAASACFAAAASLAPVGLCLSWWWLARAQYRDAAAASQASRRRDWIVIAAPLILLPWLFERWSVAAARLTAIVAPFGTVRALPGGMVGVYDSAATAIGMLAIRPLIVSALVVWAIITLAAGLLRSRHE